MNTLSSAASPGTAERPGAGEAPLPGGPGATTCSYCLDPVDPSDPGTYRRIEGWERKALDPARRGGSDIKLREPLNEFAHSVCVDRVARGINARQESLL